MVLKENSTTSTSIDTQISLDADFTQPEVSEIVTEPEHPVNSELLLAREQHHFSTEDLEKAFITGDVRGAEKRDYIKKLCGGLIALCEMYDIKIAGMGIEGSYPFVVINVKPSVGSGSDPNKLSRIYELPINPIMKREKPQYLADFDVRVWDVPATFKPRFMGDWQIDL